MLKCEHLVKDYVTGDGLVHAIRDLTITFRDNEFVSILGPSGCGKTTLLNIIGGLDNYNAGNLIINGRSTKDYTDKDWDTYRNHRIGFVFQSYNLIMHQSVLSNVELALTLTGVEKEERRRRAVAALEKVGLRDQLNKKPTQMSGGQMQRVAIARALVNDPDILLADEPTGALDSKTSVQIMDLLQEIAKDRLVVMVTHNPELAHVYSTRIVELKDGQIVSDSKPVDEKENLEEAGKEALKKPSMSFWTALSLSLNNLMTKKGRTFLTAFAGSIGIIGIGLIMSLSNGVQSYITSVENDTMTSYPITIEDNTMDMSVLMGAMMDMGDERTGHDDDRIYTKNFANKILSSIAQTESNNLTEFKTFLQSKDGEAFRSLAKAIEYDYDLTIHAYNPNAKTEKGLVQVAPNGLMEAIGMSDMMSLREQFLSSSMNAGNEVWNRLPDSQALRDDEYELVDGHWPENYDEVVIEVDENNEISDYTMYSLGLMDQDELVDNYNDLQAGKIDEIEPGESVVYTKDELLDTTFKLVLNSAFYEKQGNLWIDKSEDEAFVDQLVRDGLDVKIVGIIRPAQSTVSHTSMGGVYYPQAMQDYIIEKTNESDIVREQKENKEINVFTGRAFSDEAFDPNALSDAEKMQLAQLDQKQLMEYMNTMSENANATYASNMIKLGAVDRDTPSSISIYASSFDDKEALGDLITAYNEEQEALGHEENVISYNDMIGVMLSGVSDVINMISYVLIGFVSVSLIVSSIMIGIITYISVLERKKEIGILRAMGASKRDVRRVFNAETFIVGLIAGLIGVGITVLLNLPISMIVQHYTDVANIAVLPWQGGAILVAINLVLTMLAGLIPASMASKKDPVEALRSE
ncbi:ABC transporter ATP-binding protein/permease [Dubosiella muris]|mgnify:FL=1|uniref:ABC transporter ATP-binding protein/permease n=3 Tax=Dubosiella TaxID=1937008 RepID=A0AC61R555_9FIRM|nr:ABC transporter ATP-binding protein/permease [Dubosiella muris]TGY64989.1 ABC transporter ATP-binding protein/permease [Dubosiella muris]